MSSVSVLLDRAPVVDPTSCRHCGEPCSAGVRTTDDGAFCCRGCATVFAVLAAHDLSEFYRCDVRPGTSQRAQSERPSDRFAVLDQPAMAAKFSASRGEFSARAVFTVPSMHCAACLWLLERLWRIDAGILRSEANLLARTVTIDFQPSVISLRRVAELLASIGYEPVLDPQPAGGAPVARRQLYVRLGLAGFAFGNVMLFSIPRYANGGPLPPEFARLFGGLNLAFSLPVLLYSAAGYFRAAWAAVRSRTLTLDVPVALGLAVLYARSVTDIVSGRGEGFLDSFSGLVFFLLIGQLFQQKAFEAIAFDRTVRSFLPLSVRVERAGADGSPGYVLVPIDALAPGDIMVLRASEVAPTDAVRLDDANRGGATGEDDAAIDYAFVTGEAAPVPVMPGAAVHAGGRVVGRAVRLMVLRPTAASRLSALWSDPIFDTPKPHRLTTQLAVFGRWFTAGALGLAAVGAVLWWPNGRAAIDAATAVLIIACPCAFTLAAPITLGTAMGALGRAGVFVRQPATVLDLGSVDTLVFDKTGTLSGASGAASAGSRERAISGSGPTGTGMTATDWAAVRRLAAQSVHPVSRAIAAGLAADGGGITDVCASDGAGIRGLVDGRRVAIGSAAFVGAIVAAHPSPHGRAAQLPTAETTATWAAVDGRCAPVEIRRPIRPGVEEALRALAATHDLRLLSGDDAAEASSWRHLFGDRMAFRQSPADKRRAVHALAAAGRRVGMIGDGLNDAGALAGASVGIAVADDTACIVPRCDVVMQGHQLAHLPALLAYATRARRVIRLCLAVSLAYNAIGISLAMSGHLTPLATAVLMPVSSLTIVALSVGLMRRAAPAPLVRGDATTEAR